MTEAPAPERPLTEGERWSREQLAALRAGRFTPRAVAAFLVASQQRTNRERTARPVSARRSRAWIAAGTGAYGALAIADPRARAALPGTLAWWAATWVMLDWHLGMLETAEGVQRELGPADAVTLARCWAVPLAARGASPELCLAAWASDGLDGKLARATAPTRLGELEGLVDACFAAAALRGAWRSGALPGWAVAGELARLGGGFGYALWVWFGRVEAPDARVARAGRRSTPVRVAGLVAAGAGRRRLAAALVGGGSAWSLGALAAAFADA